MTRRFNWGTGITLVYVVFALGTVGMVALSMAEPVDLVSADYYAQSLSYDQRIAATERADALGTGVSIVVEANAIVVSVPVGQVASAHGSVTLYRPSAAAADRTLPLALDAAGRQRVSVDGLATGLWRVRLDWTAARDAFYRETVIELR